MRVSVAIAACWTTAIRHALEIAAPTPTAINGDFVHAANWDSPAGLATDVDAAWGVATATDRTARATWTQYATLARISAVPWGVSTSADRHADSPWGEFASRLQTALNGPWGVSTAADRAAASPWGEFAARLSALSAVPWGISAGADLHCPSPWGKYNQRLALVVEVPTEPGQETAVIPIQRSYIVINDINLERVSDGLDLPAKQISLSIDADAWTWGFNANLPASALDDVIGSAGAPVELAAWINGTQFRLIVERVARSRQFARADIQISGRGIAALLDTPYAATASIYSADAITAQQAAIAAITAVGLPADWSVDWQITDWLLPAGLWSHQGSPISAVNRIAAAAGAYVQSDVLNKVLHIQHRYPTAPWNWSGVTPDIEVPSAIATTEAIEWIDSPDYDVVYVSGEVGGVLGKVLRTGTAGVLPAQMVTDNLITHTDAARQRGQAILGAAGRMAMVSLSMPVLTEYGLILPGSMVSYVDGATTRIGIARSVNINASMPTVSQTVEIETHE